MVLVKPQFEAGRNKVGKNGVVRDRATHLEVLENAARLAAECGFSILELDYSPITGPKGISNTCCFWGRALKTM